MNLEKKNYAWPVSSINREDYDALVDCEKMYHSKWNAQQLILYGAGIRGTAFCLILKELGYDNLIFIDGNEDKCGGVIFDYPIYSPKWLETNREDKQIIITTENSKEIEYLLGECGFKKNNDYYVIYSNLYEKYVDEFKRIYQEDILMMGDCEFTTVSLLDKNKKNLKEMLMEMIGKERVKVLAMHGLGLRSQYNIIRSQLKIGMKPKLLVLMINFDTLNGKQHLLPRSQHEDLLKKIYNITPKPDDEWKAYLSEVRERMENLQAEFGVVAKLDDSSQIENRNRLYFRLNYLYSLNVETEGIQYLRKILELTNQERIKVLPYIPSVNYEYGRELFGEIFDKKYDENVEKVSAVCQQYGYSLYDMSKMLGKENFSKTEAADETLNYLGRTMTAKLFVTKIKEHEICI